jgi:hypothetical protein
MPQFGGTITVSSEEDGVIEGYGDVVSIENGGASGIAELAHR